MPSALVARAHELLTANMPFLENNLVYYPMPSGMWRYEMDKESYDASRVPVYLAEDLFEGSIFHAVNAAVGYGALRVFDATGRPGPRDVAIFRDLPNELGPVAGVITLHPQTVLSHVNLRAVQDGIPNAYIGNALTDGTIAGLIGRYVRFEVSDRPPEPASQNTRTNGLELRVSYSIREASAEEVAAHHEARRPAAAQAPARDLTVTAYADLDDIGFADADAFGVKAANLAELRELGFVEGTVPDGYALPFHYYDAFMRHNGFYDDVDDLLADDDFQARVAVREEELGKLRRRMRNGAVPAWMTTSLDTLHGLFPAGTSVRCRSSTNNEDLPGFSGAGLYDSYTHRATEGKLEETVKQVFASLWNLRAYEERWFHRVDHRAAAMGVLLHPNYSDELANGVAVSDDPVYGTAEAFYVNAQVGEELVTNPTGSALPEELLLGAGEALEVTVVRRSSLAADDAAVLADAHVASLHAALRTIHAHFAPLYGVGENEAFAMEIEFKVTADDRFVVKQARPWVY